MFRFLGFIICSFFATVAMAQNTNQSILQTKFKNFDIITANTQLVYDEIIRHSTRTNEYTLHVSDDVTWKLDLTPSNIIADDYKLSIQNEDGLQVKNSKPSCLPMQGFVSGNSSSRVSLTFDRDFIYGFISAGGTTYYIEPLSYYIKSSAKDQFIMYSTNDIIEDSSVKCGYELQKEKMDAYRQTNRGDHVGSRTGLCYYIRYALASDNSMVQNLGSVTAVQNHNIGVVNNVQTNYDDDFSDEFVYQISEQWVSNCSTCDPWTSSTDSGAFLDDFTSWATSGFTTIHDIGGCWTNRNFNSGVIGLAWVGTVCTQFRYHVLEDFSTNANLKRVMVAHEIGHNFDASHNTGIMAPSVSNTNTWSGTSINEITNFYTSLNCLDNCVSANPPTADFSYTVLNNCTPANVFFTNMSSNATDYMWEFEGGTPATSTQFEPTVQWDESGTYNVTLTAIQGANSHSITLPITIEVIQNPVADFTYSTTFNDVFFTFIGSSAYTFQWNFGDGSATSAETNPSHTYAVNGTYTVTLTVTNPCETSTISYDVVIQFPPTISFTAAPTSGCNPLTVQFTNTSTNATSFEWIFQGGTPATSTEQNPTVVYNSPGTFNVLLIGYNSYSGSEYEQNGLIHVLPLATSSFGYTVNGLTVNFNNTSQNGTAYEWTFGDGSTSTNTNPSHTYSTNGTYTVQLSTFNDCGTVTSSQNFTIGVAPVAGFSASQQSICNGNAVQFTSTSSNSPTSYMWSFPGGTPSTSTEQNPSVTYLNTGNYSVTLIVNNAFGADTLTMNNLISVTTTPTVNFNFISDALTFDFTSQIQNGSLLSWNFGDGATSTSTNPTHTYASEGNYTVVLTAQNGCGTQTSTQQVTAQLLPSASIQFSTNMGCTPSNIQFTAQNSPSVTAWLWTFEGGTPSTSTLQNPTVTYSNPGTFDVTLTVTNSTGSTTVQQNDAIVIGTLPTANFSTGIVLNNLTLANTGVGATTTQYIIQGPNGFSQQINTPNATITLPLNGDYTIAQTNENFCGQAMDSKIITINAYTTAQFTVSNSAPCEGTIVQIMNNSTNAQNYNWTVESADPATSTDANPQFTFTEGGLHLITLITSNALGADTFTNHINVGYLPESRFGLTSAGATITCVDSSHFASNIIWHFGDGSSSTDVNPSHTYSSNGMYTVQLIANNACGTDTSSQSININIVSSHDYLSEIYGLKVYPNPTSNIINVDCGSMPAGEYTFELIDVLGKSIQKSTEWINASHRNIQMQLQPQVVGGQYILKIAGGSERFQKSIIVLK
ncbi:MAG: PKD domain-containing protein [Lewinellaceae bacterium]|nr:PKD domain-containing protein [Lewinellaceae bacterium]